MAVLLSLKFETLIKCKLTCLVFLLLQINQASMYHFDIYPDISKTWLKVFEETEALLEINNPVKTLNNYVVEIALICDRDFSGLFQHNQTKMLEYWQAMFYDVQLRYNTLPSTKFTFRVNELLTLEVADQQAVVEVARVHLDTVSVMKTNPAFPKWLHQMYGNSANFDIAILAIGARVLPGSEIGFGFRNEICNATWRSSLVFSVRTSDAAFVLAHEIAHVLGASHDDEVSYSKNQCGELPKLGHLMRLNDTIGEPGKRHFFSKCSNKFFAGKYPISSNNCLQDIKRNKSPLIDTGSMLGKPSLSFLEQCQMLRNSSAVFVNQKEASCKLAICRTGTFLWGSVEFIEPFNGSPCNDDNGAIGECFFDICMPPGIVLKNSASNHCLNEYKGWNVNMYRKAVSVDCSISNLDLIRIRQNGNNGMLLMKYSWDSENEVQRKCLTLLYDTNDKWIPGFAECSSNSNMTWNITIPKNQNISSEFVLYHPKTGMCLGFTEDFGEVIGTRNCSQNNVRSLWTLMLQNGGALTHTSLHQIVHSRESNRQVWEDFQSYRVIENALNVMVIVICVAYILGDILWQKYIYLKRRYEYAF